MSIHKNEVLAYRHPSLRYEGSFFIPLPNHSGTKWYDDYYIPRKLIKKDAVPTFKEAKNKT
jgi:hypothetical protein